MKCLMQAVIMIGGHDSHRDKTRYNALDPFLLIEGRTLLEHLLWNLRRFGFQDFLLLTEQPSGPIQEHYGPGSARASQLQASITIVAAPSPIGSAGAIKAARDLLEDQFLFLYSDTIADFNYLDLAHCTRDEEPTDWLGRIALTCAPDARHDGLVTLEGCRVTGLQAHAIKGEPSLVNCGVYWLNSQLLDSIEGSSSSLEQHVFPKLIASGRLIGRCYPGPGMAKDRDITREALSNRLSKPAAFLDRDGTLNRDTGYTSRIEDFHWLDGAKAAIKKLNDAGYLVFMVSNQSGIARGYYDCAAVDRLHHWMQDDLAACGAHLDDIRYCPHHPEGIIPELAVSCDCRKPNPGMLHSLIKQWQPDLANSFMLGDAGRDAQAGKAAGVTGKKIIPGSILQEVESMIWNRQQAVKPGQIND
jgi:D,D-heptose 1,7-bisphosphate phosphatase